LALWRQLDPRNLNNWIPSSTQLFQIVAAAQLLQAQESEQYVAAALAAQGFSPEPAGTLNASMLAGIASDGRDLLSLLQLPTIATKVAIRDGSSVDEAMSAGQSLLQTILRTQVSDAGRVADSVNTIARPETRWVRVLYGETCARCALLAGRVYRAKADFLRHPRCDCYSVPVHTEDNAKEAGLITSPREYFNSLSRDEQDQIFTKAGAEAIRHGADISQVVNARRGMTAAGTTREGTTRRGLAGMRLQGAPRLMPEQIYRDAKSRDEAINLLKKNGYII